MSLLFSMWQKKRSSIICRIIENWKVWKFKPPDVWRAFVRVKPDVLKRFIDENGFQGMPERAAEDEFVSRNFSALE